MVTISHRVTQYDGLLREPCIRQPNHDHVYKIRVEATHRGTGTPSLALRVGGDLLR